MTNTSRLSVDLDDGTGTFLKEEMKACLVLPIEL